jgi:hypothetical protein
MTILPPEIFPSDMQPLIYFTILPLIVIFAFIGLVLLIIVYVMMPIEAKTHLWNKLKKKPLMDHTTNTGQSILETITTYGEGITIGDRTGNVYILPQPIGMDMIVQQIAPELEAIKNYVLYNILQQNKHVTDKELEEAINDPNKLQKILDKPEVDQKTILLEIQKAQNERIAQEAKAVKSMENEVLHPSICQGTGVPIFRSYGSKALGVKLSHLVGLEYDGNENRTTHLAIPLSIKTGKRVEPVKLFLEKGEPTIDKMVLPVSLPVDPAMIKKYFPKMWNPGQVTALKRVSEEIGAKRGQKKDKMMIYLMIVFAVMAGAIGFLAGNLL